MKKPKISILLAAYKSEGLLEKVFIPSFIQNSQYDTQLVIYDNGGNGAFLSTMKTNILSNEEALFRIIGDSQNIGLNAALNKCAEVATGDFFFLPHSDMYLLPSWDTALLAATKNHPPSSQLLCSRSIEPTKGHTDYHLIKNYGREWQEFNGKKLLEDVKDYQNPTIVTGYRMPFFMHRTLWEKMHGVDPNYFSYCTDDDLVQTAYETGIRKFWMVYDSLVYHMQGKSNQQQTVDKDSNAPYEYFVKKWKDAGYKDAAHPAYWHPKLIPWYTKVQ